MILCCFAFLYTQNTFKIKNISYFRTYTVNFI
nr:MAG TPA: hypothetical protein [Caudoviricetes sp.]